MSWLSLLLPLARLEAKAIQRPSGDQVGELSSAGLSVRLMASLPSAFIT